MNMNGKWKEKIAHTRTRKSKSDAIANQSFIARKIQIQIWRDRKTNKKWMMLFIHFLRKKKHKKQMQNESERASGIRFLILDMAKPEIYF